jgi:hypothetical protein
MPTDDEWMHELLEDSVSDVAPHERLEEIRAKTLKSRPHRAWPWAAGTAVVATAATVAAVAVIGGGPETTGTAGRGFAGSSATAGATKASRPAPASPSAASSLVAPAPPAVSKSTATDTTGSQPAGTTQTVPVYFVGQTPHGARLYREFQKVTGSPAQAAAQAAVSGAAADPDYHSPWPSGAQVTQVTSGGSTIAVDLKSGGRSLADRPAGMSRSDAQLAVQQLVYTVQGALSSTAPVSFTVDNKPASTLLGVDVSGGVKRAPDWKAEALVWVTAPVEGEKVHSPFTVNGLASAFEANVVWELKQNGHVVKQGNTTAKQAYMMAPYHFTVDAPPGHYTLVVHDSDASGKGRVTEDTKDITVLP